MRRPGSPHPGEDGGSERVGAEPRSHSSRAGARPRAAPDLPCGLREQGPTPPAAPPHRAPPPRRPSLRAPLTPRAPHLAAAAAAAALRPRTLQRPPLRRPRPRPRLRSPASPSSSREKSWPAEGPRRPGGARPQRACALRTSARPSPASAMWRRIYDPRWARPRPPGAPPLSQKPILFRGRWRWLRLQRERPTRLTGRLPRGWRPARRRSRCGPANQHLGSACCLPDPFASTDGLLPSRGSLCDL